MKDSRFVLWDGKKDEEEEAHKREHARHHRHWFFHHTLSNASLSLLVIHPISCEPVGRRKEISRRDEKEEEENEKLAY